LPFFILRLVKNFVVIIRLYTEMPYSRFTVQVLNLADLHDSFHAMTNKSSNNPLVMLNDPGRVTVSVSQAAIILGVAKSTAHNSYKKSGYLCDGVPVMRVGRRCVVSIAHLRSALGLPDVVPAP
jgi:hypothetical protein